MPNNVREQRRAVQLPSQLAAPKPSWTREVDVVVLGSGAAGLAAALAARPVREVLIVTKDTLDAGSTAWAQGGLAAGALVKRNAGLSLQRGILWAERHALPPAFTLRLA